MEFQKGNLLLVVCNEKRQVAHLSTASSAGTALKGTVIKPNANIDYNKYMAGVDICKSAPQLLPHGQEMSQVVEIHCVVTV